MSRGKKVTLWVSPGWGNTFRIHLREGETREFSGFRYTDEGTASFGSSFTLKDGEVIRHEETDGRDCDGRFSTDQTLVCPVGRLKAYRPSNNKCRRVRFPVWESASYRQRDYEAEKAGY